MISKYYTYVKGKDHFDHVIKTLESQGYISKIHWDLFSARNYDAIFYSVDIENRKTLSQGTCFNAEKRTYSLVQYIRKDIPFTNIPEELFKM